MQNRPARPWGRSLCNADRIPAAQIRHAIRFSFGKPHEKTPVNGKTVDGGGEAALKRP